MVMRGTFIRDMEDPLQGMRRTSRCVLGAMVCWVGVGGCGLEKVGTSGGSKLDVRRCECRCTDSQLPESQEFVVYEERKETGSCEA